MTLAKKRSASRKGAPKRASSGRGSYRGLYVVVTRGTVAKNKNRVEKDRVILAVDDADESDWVPILLSGRVDYIKMADIQRVPSTTVKVTSAQREAGRRVARRSGARVSKSDAAEIRAEWKR